MKTQNFLELKNIDFSYGERELFHNLSLNFSNNRLHGLLGPNGAGKSTLMKILSGLLLPHAGNVMLEGQCLYGEQSINAGQYIGLLSDRAPLYMSMSVWQYLEFCCRIKRVQDYKSRVEELITQLELQAVAYKILQTLSTGYRQRVALAQALVHRPKILILDEPTSGLDPSSASHLKTFLRNLGKDHHIIFSSHLLHEVEQLCDHVTMLYNGKILFHGEMSQALNRNPQGTTHLMRIKVPKGLGFSETDFSKNNIKIIQCVHRDDEIHLDLFCDKQDEMTHLLQELLSKHYQILELAQKKEHLEESFLQMVSSAKDENRP